MPTPSQHAFSERVALVVNAGGPVGRAVSMQLGLYGSYVIAADSNLSENDQSAIDELRSLGTLAHTVEAKPDTVEGAARLIDEVQGIYGRLDLLVNCLTSPSADAGFEEVVGSVLSPAYHVTSSARRLLEMRPKAAIVNVLRYPPDPGDLIVESVNAAVERLTLSFAGELPSKIRINAVSIREDRAAAGAVAEALDPELFRPRAGVEPDDAARAVIFLLSSEAKGVSGQVLNIG